MSKKSQYLFLLISSGLLLAFFIFKNGGKLITTQESLSRIYTGKKLQVLFLKNQKTYFSFPLATSDLFDNEGERQINFAYLTQDQLNDIASRISRSSIFINDAAVAAAKITRLHKSALSISLPKHKLYLLAPPHMQMAIRALKYEKKTQKDVFNCDESEQFCASVQLAGFGGMSQIIEKNLDEDTFKGEEAFPRGRWVTNVLGLSLASDIKQKIVLRYTMKTPMVMQAVHIKRPSNAKLTMIRHGELGGLKIPGVSFADFIFDVELELVPGNNVIELNFDIVTEKSVDVPMAMSGILMDVNLSPAH